MLDIPRNCHMEMSAGYRVHKERFRMVTCSFISRMCNSIYHVSLLLLIGTAALFWVETVHTWATAAYGVPHTWRSNLFEQEVHPWTRSIGVRYGLSWTMRQSTPRCHDSAIYSNTNVNYGIIQWLLSYFSLSCAIYSCPIYFSQPHLLSCVQCNYVTVFLFMYTVLWLVMCRVCLSMFIIAGL